MTPKYPKSRQSSVRHFDQGGSNPSRSKSVTHGQGLRANQSVTEVAAYSARRALRFAYFFLTVRPSLYAD